ncbi:MAG: head GIN domain-containing protein [Mangrovibacterium sp.]
MKTIKLRNLWLLLLFCSLSLGVNAAKEKTDTQTRSVESFSKISVSSGIDLFLTQGNSEAIVVEADPDIIDKIITRVEDGTLRIYIKDNQNWNWGWNQPRKAYVTFDDLTTLTASAGSDVYSQNAFKLNELDIEASSGSDIKIANLTAEFVRVRTSSGSDAEVSGKTVDLVADSSSGSDLDCGNLVAEHVEVSASSGSDATVHVTGSLKARASSGADIRYKGSPTQKDIDESSGGDVKNY